MVAVVVKVATVLLVVVTALAVGCSIQSATILSWYTVASGTVAVVVRVATILLSGCNSSCSRLQYTQCYSTSWYTVASGMVGVVVTYHATSNSTVYRGTVYCETVMYDAVLYYNTHLHMPHTLMPPTPVLPIVRLTCSSQFLHVLQQLLSYMYATEPQYGCIYSTESASQVICRLLAPCKKLGN